MKMVWTASKKFINILTIFFMFQCISFAAPLVTSVSTNTISHNQTISITGSGFGTKTTTAPLKWDDFEGGQNNAILNASKWDTYSANDNGEPRYSNKVNRLRSTISAACNFSNGNYNSSFGIVNATGALTSIYIDGWVYYDARPPYSRNFKLWRNYYWNGGTPNFYANLYCSNLDNTMHVSQDGGGTSHWWINTYGSAYFGNRWRHVQAYLVQSGAGQANGIVKVWIDGKAIVNSTNANTRGSGENAWDTIWIGNYLGHDADGECPAFGDAYVYWDDVYIDTTQARIELGNNPIYENCTKREIQIPTGWTNSALSFTSNLGSLENGSSAYLFVVDSNGTINSQGYQITIGGSQSDPGGDSQTPSSPQGLKVVE